MKPKRLGQMVNCMTCNFRFYKPRWQLKKSPLHFCGAKCRGKAQQGQRNGRYSVNEQGNP